MSGRTGPREQEPRPTPTCCACVVHNGRLLLIQRAREPGKGGWSFPGGRIRLGETIFAAVTREVREETGIEIRPLRVFQVYDWITRDEAGRVLFHYVVSYVRASYLSGEAHPGDDAAQACWVTEPELEALEMHPFTRQTAVRLLRQAQAGSRPARGKSGPPSNPSAKATEGGEL